MFAGARVVPGGGAEARPAHPHAALRIYFLAEESREGEPGHARAADAHQEAVDPRDIGRRIRY